jgi:hypothetical protein
VGHEAGWNGRDMKHVTKALEIHTKFCSENPEVLNNRKNLAQNGRHLLKRISWIGFMWLRKGYSGKIYSGVFCESQKGNFLLTW